MILYFTGTGNSLYVAEALAERLDDEMISMNQIIKHQEPKQFYSTKPFVFVCPIYAWRIPAFLDDFLLNTTFRGTKKIYFVPTMGSETGKADKYVEETVHSLRMEYMGLCGVPMPDNCISLSKTEDKESIEKKLKEALPLLDEIAAHIKNEEAISKKDKTAFAGIKSGMINSMFQKNFVTDKNYIVSDACIGCKECWRVCPVNNIKMEDNKPVFQHSCVACYACIQHCPKHAINIKGKTEKKELYVCPLYGDKEN